MRLADEQRAVCKHCGHVVIWYFDRDEDGELTPFGWWYDAETMLEACGGPAGGESDDNLWHETP